jgi:outer membrane lipoprotein-sorting protein
MKKFTIIFAAIMSFCAITVKAQTLQEVLDNYFKTIGQDKLLTIQSMVTKGKLIQGGIEIPIIGYNKRPDKVRLQGTFQGMTFVQAYNGKNGWSLNPFAGDTVAKPLTPEQLDSFKDQADMDGLMYNYKEKGYKAELLPEETVDGQKTFPVQITKPNGNVYINYIDADNYVIIKTKAKVKLQGVERESETFFSNYKPLEGMIFPFAVDTKFNGQTVAQMVIDTVEFNKELSDSLFTLEPEQK